VHNLYDEDYVKIPTPCSWGTPISILRTDSSAGSTRRNTNTTPRPGAMSSMQEASRASLPASTTGGASSHVLRNSFRATRSKRGSASPAFRRYRFGTLSGDPGGVASLPNLLRVQLDG